MRPIDKGEKPKQKFKKYGDAAPLLETRIGAYCSYCEFSIKHVPEVDHVVSKSKGGELLEWDNFLLACKYCNTRKKAVVDENNKANFLWPDEYNTFMAYTYKNGIPKINRSNLQDKGADIIEKAENLFNSVWMEAFEDVPFIRKLLIEAFVGTNKNCFDQDGNPVWWTKTKNVGRKG